MQKTDQKYTISRHDTAKDQSLRPWNAADELLLSKYREMQSPSLKLGIFNDRFGFLACNLNEYNPLVIIHDKTQEKAIISNFDVNKISHIKFAHPLSSLDNKLEIVLLKIPKSLELFRFFLDHIAQNSSPNVKVVCGFMTRHFSPKMLQIAQEYFDIAEQSKALKKARLLILDSRKNTLPTIEKIKTIHYNGTDYKQYLGVFSSQHIDYATQFFLDHLIVKPNDKKVLDLASGNGIIGIELSNRFPELEIHLLDNAYLAIESGKMNTTHSQVFHHYDNNLSNFEDDTFDLIVSNPPFHNEYEIDINTTIQLFEECHRCLKNMGNLQVVSNNHLNYITHLSSIFSDVIVLAQNDKFTVYQCYK